MALPRYTIRGEKPHQWLDAVLAERGVSNALLARKIRTLGIEKANKATVGKWRAGDLLLPLQVLPAVCAALDYPLTESDRLTLSAFSSAYPFLRQIIHRTYPVAC